MSGAATQVLPSRFVQEREFRHSVDGSAHQNLGYAWSVGGVHDAEALRHALTAVIHRHEILRTSFRELNGEVVEVVDPSAAAPVWTTDLASRAASFDATVLGQLRRPFALISGPLLRIVLGMRGRRPDILVLVVAHILWDARSSELLRRELEALCASADAPVPSLPIQFGDFASFERDAAPDSAVRYWRQQLGGYDRYVALPCRERPSSFAPAEHAFEAASPTVGHSLERLAQAERSTLSIAVLASFVAWLSVASQQQELTVAVADANRDRGDLRDLLGYLVGVNLIRIDVAGGRSFRALVQQVHQTVAEAFAHPVPAEQQVGDSADLVTDATPLCDALFNFVPPPSNASPSVLDDGPRLTPRSMLADWAKFPARAAPWGVQLDLELWARPSGAIAGTLSYNADAFDAQTAVEATAAFARTLDAVSSDPNVALDALRRSGWSWHSGRRVRSPTPRPGTSANSPRGSDEYVPHSTDVAPWPP